MKILKIEIFKFARINICEKIESRIFKMMIRMQYKNLKF